MLIILITIIFNVIILLIFQLVHFYPLSHVIVDAIHLKFCFLFLYRFCSAQIHSLNFYNVSKFFANLVDLLSNSNFCLIQFLIIVIISTGIAFLPAFTDCFGAFPSSVSTSLIISSPGYMNLAKFLAYYYLLNK